MSNEEQVQKEKETRKKTIRDILLSGDSEIGYVQSKRDDSQLASFESLGDLVQNVSRPMPKKIFDIGKEYGAGFPADIRHVVEAYSGSESVYENNFISMDDCSEEQKKEILKRTKKVEKFQEKVSKSEDGRYDKKGVISIPIYETNNMEYVPFPVKKDYPRAKVADTIEIEVTQRELAEAGILPEDFKWMEKTRVSVKDIAEADKGQALTTTEIGGFKGFIKKLLDRFKGKEEK